MIIRLGQVVIPLAPPGISKNEIVGILIRSFHNVFSKRQTRYPRLVHCLQKLLNRDYTVGQSKNNKSI